MFGPVVALISMSKWIKFVGHFLRHPVDVLLLPILITFGYLHGAIKLYAACTLHVVSPSFYSAPHVGLFCHPQNRSEFIRQSSRI